MQIAAFCDARATRAQAYIQRSLKRHQLRNNVDFKKMLCNPNRTFQGFSVSIICSSNSIYNAGEESKQVAKSRRVTGAVFIAPPKRLTVEIRIY